MTMGKKMKNSNKLHIFPLLLKKDIGLQAVQDRWAINNGVIELILHRYRMFVEKKTLVINPQH
jgi:hypothetical protein